MAKLITDKLLNITINKILGFLNGKVDKVDGKGLSTNDLTSALKTNYDAAYAHTSNKQNPHNVTAKQLGLENIPNVSTNDQTPTYNSSDTLEELVSGETLSVSMGKISKAIEDEIAHLADKENPHEVTAAQVGAIATSEKGAPNGVAKLDENGLIPLEQLPSYADDIIDAYYYNEKMYKEPEHITEITGESGKIYIDLHTSTIYRWSGSAYDRISASIILGETSSTAFRGDYGKIAYEHALTEHARTDATKVEASSTNGNIKINEVETPIYVHPTTLGNLHVPTGSATAKTNGYVLRCNSAGYPVWEQSYEYIPDGPEGSYSDVFHTQTSGGGITDPNKPSSATYYTRTFKIFGGSTESEDGTPGLVPAPEMTSEASYLRNDGTWEQFQSISISDIDSMFEGTYQTN